MYFLRVYGPEGGLCTQLFALVNGLLLARAAGELVVVLDDVVVDRPTGRLCAADDVLDLDHLGLASGLLVTAATRDQHAEAPWVTPARLWADALDVEAFDRLLCGVRFAPRLHARANAFLAELDYQPINVVHARNEPDAVARWSARNAMSPDRFERALNNKYAAAVKEAVARRDTTLVVSGLGEDNAVVQELQRRGRHVLQVPHGADEGREERAIVELLVAAHACCGALVANVHPVRLNGSRFSYVLRVLATGASREVLVDLDHVEDTTVTTTR